jgi:phosphatidylserine decarboxylase
MTAGILFGIVLPLLFVLPLAWKWQLGVPRVSLFVAAIASIISLMLVKSGLQLSAAQSMTAIAGTTLCTSIAVLAYRFYRDPKRTVPAGDGLIVSPAEGRVLYVKRSERGQLPVSIKNGRQATLTELMKTPFYSDEAWVVGIGMSLLDVHVNRAPVGGRVIFRKHFPGQFGSLRSPERILDNERATLIVKSGDIEVGVVQIASRLVRQIVSFVEVGEELHIGQRIGAIRLGSQVDVVMPARPDLGIKVQVGQEVCAGETVLAKISPISSPSDQIGS